MHPAGPSHERGGEASLAQLILRAARDVRRAHTAELEPYGLSPSEARALRMISRHGADGGLRPADLASHLDIAPRSATEVVDRLGRHGLVQRSPSPTDRRSVLVSTTDAGRALRRRIEQARDARVEELFAGLSDAERAELTALLRRALGG